LFRFVSIKKEDRGEKEARREKKRIVLSVQMTEESCGVTEKQNGPK
jgi:hypothetical protein